MKLTYTVQEAAELLGWSPFSIYGAIRRGTLDPRIRVIRAGQSIRLAKKDIDALIGEAS